MVPIDGWSEGMELTVIIVWQERRRSDFDYLLLWACRLKNYDEVKVANRIKPGKDFFKMKALLKKKKEKRLNPSVWNDD
jgi:hypothetical protein